MGKIKISSLYIFLVRAKRVQKGPDILVKKISWSEAEGKIQEYIGEGLKKKLNEKKKR